MWRGVVVGLEVVVEASEVAVAVVSFDVVDGNVRNEVEEVVSGSARHRRQLSRSKNKKHKLNNRLVMLT
jgi:hypothetical protein